MSIDDCDDCSVAVMTSNGGNVVDSRQMSTSLKSIVVSEGIFLTRRRCRLLIIILLCVIIVMLLIIPMNSAVP
eukprot:9914023-Ditylum_brightwellii.AAC.1